MSGNAKPNTAYPRADYAQRIDFCEVFEREMKPLYLLAFLLTANHKDAEQCFTATLEQALKEQAVFKEWRRSWVKRSLINNAIQITSSTSGRGPGKRDLWGIEQHGTGGHAEIDAVTRLAPCERFVFVMSVLERYSAWECSLLLGCSMEKVARVRAQALHELPGRDAFIPGSEAVLLSSLQMSA
jgi:DNA-directed RNA polymerase specialized sigma24 family protein